MSAETAVAEKPKRIVCMDQLRAFAIFGMIIVNAKHAFLDAWFSIENKSGFLEMILFQIEHHDRECFSFANVVAPLFMFMVGMGMRLSWLKRTEKGIEPWTIRKSMFKRFFTLVLIAFALYYGWLWDALMSIGLAGVASVMWVDKKWPVRVAMAFIYPLIFMFLIKFTAYGLWMYGNLDIGKEAPLWIQLIPMYKDLFDCTLNGGPFGFLSWSMMLLFGTVAYDLIATNDSKKIILGTLGAGVGLCCLGLLARVVLDDNFTIRYMTIPAPLWASGLCFLELCVFYVLNDKLNIKIPTFASIGMNPLFIYILLQFFTEFYAGLVLPHFGVVSGLIAFIIFYFILWGIAYALKRKNIYIKI